MTSAGQRQEFERQFRGHFREEFQLWFARIARLLHRDGDLQTVRVTQGDGGLDCVAINRRRVYQCFAPARISETKDSETASKIRADFAAARQTLAGTLAEWVFVHNHPEGRLGKDANAALVSLKAEHPEVEILAWGLQDLWNALSALPEDALAQDFGPGSEGPSNVIAEKIKIAQEFVHDEKPGEAVRVLNEALAAARQGKRAEQEFEVLVVLGILGRERQNRLDREDHLRRAEALLASVRDVRLKVLFLRNKIDAALDDHDATAAETFYREALRLCDAGDEDGKPLRSQACVVGAGYGHLLCEQERLDEAAEALKLCDAHSREHADAEDGELLQSTAGLGIHLAAVSGDNDMAIRWISTLEEAAKSKRQALRFGHQLQNMANHAAHAKHYPVALKCTEAAIRLAKAADDTTLALMAQYTVAMIHLQMGEVAVARREAEALLGVCDSVPALHQAVAHILSMISRETGDSELAVEQAQVAVEASQDRPEDVAMSRVLLSEALRDDGQTELAFREARNAFDLLKISSAPVVARFEPLFIMVDTASQLGLEQEVKEAIATMQSLPDDDKRVRTRKEGILKLAGANAEIRRRILALNPEAEELKEETPLGTSLEEANAKVVAPLLGWWQEIPESASELYDFWGRGNFGRVLANAQRFPTSFNVTLEVRSVADVERAIRLWGFYADFLLLLWKGETNSGMVIAPMPGDHAGPGGAGYIVALRDRIAPQPSHKQIWFPGLGPASLLPREVVGVLANEAREFVASGRLLIVPATGVGCVHPGHGPMEQLLANASNAVACVRARRRTSSPIGWVAYSPDAPLQLLAEIADRQQRELTKLRLLLMKRSRELRAGQVGELADKELTLEIEDALRGLEDRTTDAIRRRGNAAAREPVEGSAGDSPRRLPAASVDDPAKRDLFSPLLLLRNLGYGWAVGSTAAGGAPKFEPAEDEVIGPWLSLPDGPRYPVVRRAEKPGE